MRASRFRLLLFLVFFWFLPTLRADTTIKVGSPAPALTLREVLQAPAGVRGTWEELKGKAVVIEFWATWCGGCVANIPHLDKLAEQFEAKPVQFISITDETDTGLVKRFLENHPMRGWVAFDDQAFTFKSYGIEGRPQTVLVSRDGVVQAVTNPESVTPQVLEDLLAGKPLKYAEVRSWPPLGLESGAPPPLVQVLIRPAAPVAVSGTSPGFTLDKNERYDLYGVTLRGILSRVYGIPENRVEAPEWCSNTRYDLSIVTPQHGEDLRWPLAKQGLEAAFRLKLHQELKNTPVYILRRTDKQEPKLHLSGTKEYSGHLTLKGEFEANSAPIARLAQIVHGVLGADVIDETGLTDFYAFDLKWDKNQPTSIIAAIHEQLGLELAAESKRLEHLVVDTIDEAKTW